MSSKRWSSTRDDDWGCDICGRDTLKHGLSPHGITRRGFMKNGALALIGTSAIPAFLTRSVLAEATTAAANNKKLVIVFQRGAVDGLNVVIPYREKNYYASRPSIAIQPGEAIDLDGFFALQAALQCGSTGNRSCRRFARPIPFSLRRAGLYGERYPWSQDDPGRLAQSRSTGRAIAGNTIRISRNISRHSNSPHPNGPRSGACSQ